MLAQLEIRFFSNQRMRQSELFEIVRVRVRKRVSELGKSENNSHTKILSHKPDLSHLENSIKNVLPQIMRD